MLLSARVNYQSVRLRRTFFTNIVYTVQYRMALKNMTKTISPFKAAWWRAQRERCAHSSVRPAQLSCLKLPNTKKYAIQAWLANSPERRLFSSTKNVEPRYRFRGGGLRSG